MTEQKLIWPVNMTGQYSKIILSPVTVQHHCAFFRTFTSHELKLKIQVDLFDRVKTIKKSKEANVSFGNKNCRGHGFSKKKWVVNVCLPYFF